MGDLSNSCILCKTKAHTTTEAKHMPMLTQYFKQVDANNNGKVTRQEYLDAMPLLHSGKSMSSSKVQSL